MKKGQIPEGIQPGNQQPYSTTPTLKLHVVFVPTRRHIAPIVAPSLESALETASRLWRVRPARLVHLWDYDLEPMECA